jgi:hypothetical protein
MLRRGWSWYAELFGGSSWIPVLAAIPLVTAVVGIVVRGFQFDTWAWTEFYGDSNYYLAFAKSAAHGEFLSYANVSPSSGIQPLHWLHLTAIYGLTGGNQSWMFPILFFTYALAFVVTIWAVLYTLRAMGGRGRLLLIVVLAMTYGNYLVNARDIPLPIPVIFTNFVNLMASWLLITSIVLLIAAGVRHLRGSPNGWTLIVMASVVAVLARIDYLAIVFPFVAVVAWRSTSLLRWQRIVVVGAPPFAVAIWLMILGIATGMPIPTSGAVKSTQGMAFDLGLRDGLAFLIENIQVSAMSTYAVIALGGMLGCAIMLMLALRSGLSKHDPVGQAFGALLVGMFSLYVYHMVFTFAGDVGGWYFRPYRVLMLLISLFAIISIEPIRSLAQNTMVSRVFVAIAILGVGLITVSHLSAPAAAVDSRSRTHLVRDVVEQLDGIVESDATFYDGTDGAFGWYSDYTAYNQYGMANTPDYVDIGRAVRVLELDLLIPIYSDYIEEKEIDYFVTYRNGNANQFATECWIGLPKIAYSENRYGDLVFNAFATHSGDWLAYLSCIVAENP